MAPRDEQDELDPSRTDKPAGSDLSRRNFLKTVGAAGVATTVGDAALQAQRGAQPPGGTPRQTERGYTPIRNEVAGNLIKRGIVGYADHLRVQPGDTIKFMVSSERPRYRADIVRLIHGDANPKGPGHQRDRSSRRRPTAITPGAVRSCRSARTRSCPTTPR